LQQTMNTSPVQKSSKRAAHRASNGLDVRCLNLQASLNLLRDGRPMTSPEIGDALSVHPSTVSRLLGTLETADLVNATESPVARAAGRPPKTWRLNAEAGVALGLAVHSQTLRGVVVDLSGHLLSRREAGYDPPLTTEDLGQALGDFVRGMVEELCPHPVLGVGVAVSGVVDPETGVVRISGGVRTPTGVPAVDFPLREVLAPQIPWPTYVANDANVGALVTFEGMVRDGRVPPDGTLLYLMAVESLLGYGSGLVLDGRLHNGAHGAGGEILHPSWVAPVTTPGDLPLEVPRPGDEAAVDRALRQLRPILEHLAALAMTFDPHLVVMGGALPVLGDRLLAEFGGLIAQAPGFGEYMADLAADRLMLDPLRPDTISLGAAELVLDDLFRDPVVGAPGPLVELALRTAG